MVGCEVLSVDLLMPSAYQYHLSTRKECQLPHTPSPPCCAAQLNLGEGHAASPALSSVHLSQHTVQRHLKKGFKNTPPSKRQHKGPVPRNLETQVQSPVLHTFPFGCSRRSCPPEIPVLLASNPGVFREHDVWDESSWEIDEYRKHQTSVGGSTCQ